MKKDKGGVLLRQAIKNNFWTWGSEKKTGTMLVVDGNEQDIIRFKLPQEMTIEAILMQAGIKYRPNSMLDFKSHDGRRPDFSVVYRNVKLKSEQDVKRNESQKIVKTENGNETNMTPKDTTQNVSLNEKKTEPHEESKTLPQIEEPQPSTSSLKRSTTKRYYKVSRKRYC